MVASSAINAPAEPEPFSRLGAHGGALALRSLEAMLDAGRLPHALLLSGPAGIGKRDLALSIAQAVVCESTSEPSPCRRCRPCRRVRDPDHPRTPLTHADINHTDVALVEPGGVCTVSEHEYGKSHSNSRAIAICQVRWLERTISIKPFEGPARVVIIDPADAMTTEAADAFLKALEEPPPGVYFVLLSAREATLSETIRSRCRALRLTPLNHARTEAWLRARLPQAGADEITQLARQSRGRVGWLDSSLAEGDPLALRTAQIEELLRLSGASRAERIDAAEQLAGRRQFASPAVIEDLLTLLAAWSEWWRDIWLERMGRSEQIIHATLRDRLREQAAQYAPDQLTQFLRTLEQTRVRLRDGINARLAMEIMLLAMPASAAPTDSYSNGA